MKVTIEDIACLANVSKATVSRVMNDRPGVSQATRKLVMAIIDEHGYNPNLLARGVSPSRTKTIGMIIPDIVNPFFPALVKSVETELSEKGYTVMLFNTDADFSREKRAIANCISKRVDGVIFASSLIDAREVKGMLSRYDVPCVYVDRGRIDPGKDACVFVDNVYGAYLAVNYLINNGHKKVAFIAGPKDISTSAERLRGYLDALEQHRLPYNRDLIQTGDYTLQGGETAAQVLLETEPFTALFAANDVMAIGAMKAIKAKGYDMPRDIEVIGFDNISICELTEPPLSTMDQPLKEMGIMAVKTIMTLIDGKPIQHYASRIEPRLILRGTTKRR